VDDVINSGADTDAGTGTTEVGKNSDDG